MAKGYYREPTIYKNTIVFVCDDDLWEAPASGGAARRLTTNAGFIQSPVFSPDGNSIAFIGREEGYPEIYIMPAKGGDIQRLTFLGNRVCRMLGWSLDGKDILFASAAGQAFYTKAIIYAVPASGGLPRVLPYGPAASISFQGNGGVVLGRHGRDAAQWKRYRGGTIGRLWVDPNGSGKFTPLMPYAEPEPAAIRRRVHRPVRVLADGNMSYPMWINDRIYFFSDYQGIGNIYSCKLDGEDIHRHTDSEDFYVRNPKTDKTTIVYQAGAEIYALDIKTDKTRLVPIELNAPRPQRVRKFVSGAAYLEEYTLHPKAHSLAIVTRGKVCSFAHWEGPVKQYGVAGGSVRYRLAKWLNDGQRMVAVSDEGGEEAFEVFSASDPSKSDRLSGLDIGRPITVEVNPVADQVAFTNHRQELILLDLKTRELRVLDHSVYARINGFSWSPDGRWIAYGFANTRRFRVIKICEVSTNQKWEISRPVLQDDFPAFDPDGKYLYFLGKRIFDPIPEAFHTDYAFTRGALPMLITLQKNLVSPFLPQPKGPGEEDTPEGDEKKKTDEPASKEPPKPKPVIIDFEGIKDRIVPFPVPEGLYAQIQGGKNKVFFTSWPVKGILEEDWPAIKPPSEATLEVYDFKKLSTDTFASGITNFELSKSGNTIAYRAGDALRVVKTEEKPDPKFDKEPPSRASGWINLNRVKVAIDPVDEWKQMYRETWRLLRDHYYIADMAQVDWNKMYDRYLPLVERIGSRLELSDICWELGGEMGTSHCYEIGGDYRMPPRHPQGFLGADYTFDGERNAYKITHIIKANVWDPHVSSPLTAPGVNVVVGDFLLAINGIHVSAEATPQKLLVNKGGEEVTITIEDANRHVREVIVKTTTDEMPVRLQEWIDANTEQVHSLTKGRAGYVYLSDMGAQGISQFYRSFLSEVDRDALIIDVRANAGGHVSPLVLEKLRRVRLGYELPRWSEWYPMHDLSMSGPIVALTDEHSGSDGDVFSHCYKMLKLGPLIGKRTWGGIVGLNPTHPLVDGSVTTQPEFYNWFNDVGYGLENCGAIPDIEVEYPPQDYVRGYDPQLTRAIDEMNKLLDAHPHSLPDFSKRPNRATPKLPPRPLILRRRERR